MKNRHFLLALSLLSLPCLVYGQASTTVDTKTILDNQANLCLNSVDNTTGQAVYSAKIEQIIAPTQVQPNELFAVTIKLRNIGNQTWYNDASSCPVKVYLGTEHQRDRQSVFFAPGVFGQTNWQQGNRIKMSTPQVSSGQSAEFTFQMHAPEQPGIYREYLKPVAEGKTWFTDNSEIPLLFQVGKPEYDPAKLEVSKNLKLSINLLDPRFTGEKKIKVDLSEQKMYVYQGDLEIKKFPVSTGTNSHPTPVGNHKIQFKQEVRVGSSYPHYIMPKFMQFRKGGYGIHALPSLANDRGVYWREALNHIGTRRSHGCIRLLPADANWVFEFAEVGTPVQVVW